jgi:hypothetical protein
MEHILYQMAWDKCPNCEHQWELMEGSRYQLRAFEDIENVKESCWGCLEIVKCHFKLLK